MTPVGLFSKVAIRWRLCNTIFTYLLIEEHRGVSVVVYVCLPWFSFYLSHQLFLQVCPVVLSWLCFAGHCRTGALPNPDA